MFGKNKYIWKKIERRYSFWPRIYFDESWEDLDFFNFNAYYRKKRNYRNYVRNYDSAKYSEKEYNVNLLLRKEKFKYCDDWAFEENAKAWRERKSWKRNSKKKKQYL